MTEYTITELRARNKMSMKELALKVGVSSVYICNIENNKNVPSVKIAKKIAQALNVSMDEIKW